MPKTDEAAGQEIVIQVFRRNATGLIVEVDQYVPAKDDVETALRTRLLGVDEIDPRKAHGLAQVVQNLPALAIQLVKIACDQIRRQSHQRPLAENAFRSRFEHVRINVRSDDLDVVSVDVLPVFQQPYCD